jgi:hypothetical protein
MSDGIHTSGEYFYGLRKGWKEGARHALNSVEFKQLLLQAKVTELEKVLEEVNHLLEDFYETKGKQTSNTHYVLIKLQGLIEQRLKELK